VTQQALVGWHDTACINIMPATILDTGSKVTQQTLVVEVGTPPQGVVDTTRCSHKLQQLLLPCSTNNICSMLQTCALSPSCGCNPLLPSNALCSAPWLHLHLLLLTLE
jgi:hypothetical protein